MTAGPISTAVILAAGRGIRLGEQGIAKPKGFLTFGQRPIVEESIERLQRAGITRVIVVTGHHREFYDALASRMTIDVETVFNPHYASSGSMFSLACARRLIDGNFLLLESDLIYEQRALHEALTFPKDNAVLLSGDTGAGDEVYVRAQEFRLVAMSKQLSELNGPSTGELVGICKISASLFEHMLQIADELFVADRNVDYETDCLVAAAGAYPVYCHLVADLVWAEIDNLQHSERAKTKIYPKICELDADGRGAEGEIASR